MLAATIVAPGHAMALPLMPVLGLDPGIIAPQDSAEKQDCERNAAKRWLVLHGERVKDLRPVYLGDDLIVPDVAKPRPERKRSRSRPRIPADLPVERIVYPAPCACDTCGSALVCVSIGSAGNRRLQAVWLN